MRAAYSSTGRGQIILLYTGTGCAYSRGLDMLTDSQAAADRSMKLLLDSPGDANHITAYGEGYVDVRSKRLTGSVLLTRDRLVNDWAPEGVHDLKAEHLEGILELQPEVVLLGTGKRQQFPPTAVIAPLVKAGIGFEIMDTAAACRTYNVLLSEGRRVAAALLPLGA